MELLKQLELVNVVINEGKAVLTFLDDERGEIREVNFNKNVYDATTGNFVPDAEKAKIVDKWCDEYFQQPFDLLGKAVGEHKDIYCYDKFNSLWECEIIAKFGKDMVGQLFATNIETIEDDGTAIRIRFKYEDDLYESKLTYSEYLEDRKKWFVNPQKKAKKYAQFEEKFNRPMEEKEELIGQEIMVEVKMAFKKFIYCEIKPLIKKKK